MGQRRGKILKKTTLLYDNNNHFQVFPYVFRSYCVNILNRFIMSDHSSSDKKRRSSLSSNKSFHSIEEFWVDPLDADIIGRRARFPFRPTINILLILLTTLQVFLLVHSRIYLRGDLVRTFLSVYIDENVYPGLFEGEQFYLRIANVEELSEQLQYVFENMNTISNNSFIDMYYNESKIFLHVQYTNRIQEIQKTSVYEIDPKKGILQPFNMRNITDIQLFLLQIERYELKVFNLTVKENWEGFSEKYVHIISYQYTDSIQIQMNFNFMIDDAMVEDDDDDDTIAEDNDGDQQSQQPIVDQTPTFPILYIIKIRAFYAIVLVLAVISLYLNYLLIRRTFELLYEQLGQQSGNSGPTSTVEKNKEIDNILDQNTQQKQSSISQWVKANHITFEQLRFEHYVHLLEFDIIFSTLSNIFEIVAGFYLIYGIQMERVAGITCLLSWMTVFRLVRQYKKLVLMYELIKLSITSVVRFFAQFLPVFIAYALLGVCLFPKVSFFSSLSDSVTTLVCLMMGDSIEMITKAMIQKNSVIISIIYIFSFVLLFMHAIHNTLTSLIKQFFIKMKIQLVQKQKEAKGQSQKYLYIEEVQIQTQKIKKQLPLKLTPQLQKYLIKQQNEKISSNYMKKINDVYGGIEMILFRDNGVMEEDECLNGQPTIYREILKQNIRQEMERRNEFVLSSLKKYHIGKNHKGDQNGLQKTQRQKKTELKESLLSDED